MTYSTGQRYGNYYQRRSRRCDFFVVAGPTAESGIQLQIKEASAPIIPGRKKRTKAGPRKSELDPEKPVLTVSGII